jgi:hypothetical protein
VKLTTAVKDSLMRRRRPKRKRPLTEAEKQRQIELLVQSGFTDRTPPSL